LICLKTDTPFKALIILTLCLGDFVANKLFMSVKNLLKEQSFWLQSHKPVYFFNNKLGGIGNHAESAN
jgi:hypothetical protein